ncbi:MAG: autotransporter outer membrane beta-barrel domain-containing protein [Gammaproteobacteria bacterium]|nr:autotransporter outer membrane beta-barrel domain-containing protein [Gammaproteobacteria bacterium]
MRRTMYTAAILAGFAATLVGSSGHAEPVADAVDPLQDRHRNLIRLAVYIDTLRANAEDARLLPISADQDIPPRALLDSLRSWLPELASHHVLRKSFSRTIPRKHSRPKRIAPALSAYITRFDEPAAYDPSALPPTIFMPTVMPALMPTKGIWIQALTDSSKQKDREGIDGFESDGESISVGFDRSIASNVRTGVRYARTGTKVLSNRFGRDDLKSDEITAYTSLGSGRHSLSLNFSYSDHETERVRPILIPTADSVRVVALFSQINASQWASTLSYGASFGSNAVRVSPFASMTYANLTTDDYLEAGPGDLSLLVATDDEEQIVGAAGVGFGIDWVAGNWLMAPSLQFAIDHDFKADQTTTFTRIPGSDFGFESSGYSIQKTRLRTGIGFTAIHIKGLSAYANVTIEHKRDYDYLGAIIGLQYDF